MAGLGENYQARPGDVALHEDGGLDARLILVADHDEGGHLEGVELFLQGEDGGPLRYDAPKGVSRALRRVGCKPLFELLRGKVAGRLSEAIDALRTRENLSLKELADALRASGEVLAKKFGLPLAQADRLAQSPPEVVMQLEELDLFPTTTIELNLAAEGASPVWQPLDQLSTGQKATAVLLLVLLESDAPLIVDQPEDDLDNRFITEGIVPKMRDEKRRRQFVFTTHNANIPVLGDAELIVGLRASGEAGEGHAEIPVECMGSIDVPAVRELVEELLEGGKEAFEMRRLKYGF